MKAPQTKTLHLAFALAAITSILPSSRAAIISTFDTGTDGWLNVTLAFPNPGTPPTILATFTPTWTATGGNPGGYIFNGDPDGNVQYWLAPAKFLGNQSSTYGGSLSFDLADSPASNAFTEEDVILVGGGVTLAYALPTYPTTGAWTPFSISLVETGWRKNSLSGSPAIQADMQSALGSLSAIYIRGEYLLSADTQSIDNVRLVPEPATAVLLSLGMAALFMRRSCSRRPTMIPTDT